MLTHEEQEKIFLGLLKRKQNSNCAECGSKSPCWASLEFGVFVCLNCSGAHRALSPSVTRVKSVRLDLWNRDWLKNMQVGNTNVNLYWQHLLSDHHSAKPNENSTIDFLIKFVRDKYMRKLYINPNEPMDPLLKFKTNLTSMPEGSQTKNPSLKDPQSNTKPNPQSPKPAKLHKAATMNVPMSAVVSKKKGVEVDFTFFDEIMVQKKPINTPKVQTNLISLEEEKGPVQKRAGFDDFQFFVQEKPKEEKYNKQQFMSMGGIKPNKPKSEVNFDIFPSSHPKNNNKNNDNLINFESQKVVPTTSFNDYSTQSHIYNKAHFSTMSGNYPPKMNFPADLNLTNGAFGQSKPLINTMQSGNWLGNDYLGVELAKHKMPPRPPVQKITMQTNINIDRLGKEKKLVNGLPSWIDQWK